MPSYRFCRPDDIPLLVEAINTCYRVHFPGRPPETGAGFQTLSRELNVWASNCMVATAGKVPVGVMIATKRPHEIMVLLVGVRRDYQGKGHARHMLTSLSQKLAVLGPPRLIAEIAEDCPAGRSLLEAADYRKEASYADFERDGPAPPLADGPAIIPISVQDLLENELIDLRQTDCAWERQPATLINRKDGLEGIALASPDRIEAFLIYRDVEAGREICRMGCADPGQTLPLSILMRQCCRIGAPVRIPKLGEGEADPSWLESIGFRRVERHDRYATTARPL